MSFANSAGSLNPLVAKYIAGSNSLVSGSSPYFSEAVDTAAMNPGTSTEAPLLGSE